MKINWLSILLIMMIFTGAACGVQPVESASQTSSAPSPSPAQQNDQTTLLLWEGPALFAGDQTECHRLLITTDNQALLGKCDGEQTEVAFVSNSNGGLAGMLTRFAPFQADTPQGRVTFNGQGEIAGPAWERAVTDWAQFSYAQLATGRAGAANRTALAWHLGEQEGQCRLLLALAHGYATAGLTPCAGGQMEVIAGDWVETAEWEQFDAWLYNRAPFYQDSSYLGGRGATKMSAEEAAALAEWAENVYANLTQTGPGNRLPD